LFQIKNLKNNIEKHYRVNSIIQSKFWKVTQLFDFIFTLQKIWNLDQSSGLDQFSRSSFLFEKKSVKELSQLFPFECTPNIPKISMCSHVNLNEMAIHSFVVHCES
jgi:hypothetical protein